MPAADQYASDHVMIEKDMEHAVSLDFAEYVAYLAQYGSQLHDLAARHPAPEAALIHLRDYADKTLERLADR